MEPCHAICRTEKTLHGNRVPEDKQDFIFSSEHHAPQSAFFSTLLIKEYSMLMKKIVVAGKIKMPEEKIAGRYKSYSNYPVIEPVPLPEPCFRYINHSCIK